MSIAGVNFKHILILYGGTFFTESTPNIFIHSKGFFLLPGEREGPLLSLALVYPT